MRGGVLGWREDRGGRVWLTLPVDPQSVQQLGAAELGPEQGHIQLHQPSVDPLALARGWAFTPLPDQRPQGISLGQQAVDEMNPGPADSVQKSILQRQDHTWDQTSTHPAETRDLLLEPFSQNLFSVILFQNLFSKIMLRKGGKERGGEQRRLEQIKAQ